MGKQITPENVSEILDSELPDGCTGSARVRNDGLEIQREYAGPVDGAWWRGAEALRDALRAHGGGR